MRNNVSLSLSRDGFLLQLDLGSSSPAVCHDGIFLLVFGRVKVLNLDKTQLTTIFFLCGFCFVFPKMFLDCEDLNVFFCIPGLLEFYIRPLGYVI